MPVEQAWLHQLGAHALLITTLVVIPERGAQNASSGTQPENAAALRHGNQPTVQNATGTPFQNAASEGPAAPAFKTRMRPEHSQKEIRQNATRMQHQDA